eukprot:266023_1
MSTCEQRKCIMCGYLMKQSLHLKHFRKRWVVLKSDKALYSYQTDKTNKQKPTEIIDLRQFKYIICEKDINNNKYTITLLSQNCNTERVFMTKRKQEVSAWNKAIQIVTNNQIQQLAMTNLAKAAKNKQELIKFKVILNQLDKRLERMHRDFSDTFYVVHDERIFECDLMICVMYSQKETLGNILTKIVEICEPIRLQLYDMMHEGFTGSIQSYNMASIRNKPVTVYDKVDIIKKGLMFRVKVEYKHKVKDIVIGCEYMNAKTTDNPLKCPVYYAMKQKYEFTQENLQHLVQHSHFVNSYEDKPECKYGEDCTSYIRSEQGQNRLDDNCHMQIYRHPARTRNIKLSPNINSLIINKKREQIHPIYEPTSKDIQKYTYNYADGFVQALIEEVIVNGYRLDLCLFCVKDEECKHDGYSLLKIVDDKLKHIRHKAMGSHLNRGQMLSLVLYTGCDSNYDLCASQRKGEYKKWKWFDYCLHGAIFLLSRR